MALSFSNLLATGTTASQTSYTTASVSPTGSRLLLLGVLGGTASGVQPLAPAVSGNGLTWVLIATVDYDTAGSTDRESCFLFRAMGASPSSGTITIDFASTGQALGKGAAWVLDQSSSEVDTSGSDGAGAIAQSATAAGGSTSTSLSVTLAAFADATNNVAYGFFSKQNATAYTVGSGFTLTGEATANTNRRAMAEYVLGQDTSVDCSWTTGIRSGGIAVEVKSASAAVPLPVITSQHINRASRW